MSGVGRPGLRPSSARCCAVTVSLLSCFFEPWVYDRVYLCAGAAERACSFLGPSPVSESVGLGQGPRARVFQEPPKEAGSGSSRAGHRPSLVTLQTPGMGLSCVEIAPESRPLSQEALGQPGGGKV